MVHSLIITSRVSGRGYKNGVICVCVCVCVSVCGHCHGWTDWRTVTKFGTGIDLDDISREFDGQGQGHMSKVKVIQLKNVILEFWPRLSVLYLTKAHTKVSRAFMHAWNHEICAWAQICWALKRCSNTFLVFFFSNVGSVNTFTIPLLNWKILLCATDPGVPKPWVWQWQVVAVQ